MQNAIMIEKDARIRSIDEMLYGVKTIKVNSYQSFFAEKV